MFLVNAGVASCSCTYWRIRPVMILEGKIVRLRPITIEDAETSLAWRLGDRAKLLQRGATTVDEQREWIASKLALDEINCIIEYANAPVGMIALHDINLRNRHAIIGRELIGEKDRVGVVPVAFEAELLLCDYAFGRLNLHKLYGDVLEDNHAMLKMRRFLGYKQDGMLRDHVRVDGEYRSVYAISILQSEYTATCRPKLMQLITAMSSAPRKI